MWLIAYLCAFQLVFGVGPVPPADENVYDTYNAKDCRRVRKSWTSLSADEKQLYLDALLELRARGEGDVAKDEFVAIGSVHEDNYGEVQHQASSYLFWHGYLLWELESRIRNLGGQYACFAVPYWDFSTPTAKQDIFNDILGGYGDPDNYFTVNGYSWQYSVQEFWVPAHCDAEGDEYPMCSLKRSTSTSASSYDAQVLGAGMIANPAFADFDAFYSQAINLPHDLLTDDEYLHFPVVTSYDPIWYLFHSMVSYHQAIWTDCNNYDMIDEQDLGQYPQAYRAFCDTDSCGPIELDDRMFFGGELPNREWSWIHNNVMTIRKAFYLPKWNIVYDLGNGDGFFADSGLKEYCKGKLNPRWFQVTGEEHGTDSSGSSSSMYTAGLGVGDSMKETFSYYAALMAAVILMALAMFYCAAAVQTKRTSQQKTALYGTMARFKF